MKVSRNTLTFAILAVLGGVQQVSFAQAADECQPSYSEVEQLVNIPYVILDDASYAIKLKQVVGDSLKYTLENASPVADVIKSQCASSSAVANYFPNSGRLEVTAKTEGDAIKSFVLYADVPTVPKVFTLHLMGSDAPEIINNTRRASGAISHLDGAGSLVSPSKDAYGANKDVAPVFSHSIPSTVVFQWLKTSACHHIDITSSGLTYVQVNSKPWDKTLPEESYIGYLPLSVPARATWNTVAVTTVGAISGSSSISAACKSSTSLNSNYYSASTTTPDYIQFDDIRTSTDNYYWSGNGSVISGLGGTGYGIDRDDVQMFYLLDGMGVFQWYRSSSCPKLKLSTTNGQYVSFMNTDNDGVKIKPWDASDWGVHECTSLSCTVSRSSNGYYIVKVRMPGGVVTSPSTNYLTARCTS